MLVNSFAELQKMNYLELEYKQVYQYELWWADFGDTGREGEQRGTRPCVIISNDGFNNGGGWRSKVVNAYAVSKQLKRSPVHVRFKHECLSHESEILVEQPKTLSKDRLTYCIGVLDKETIIRLHRAMKIQYNMLN